MTVKDFEFNILERIGYEGKIHQNKMQMITLECTNLANT